jgi:predicted  nucleic acid-binding Zn-ribbon protein
MKPNCILCEHYYKNRHSKKDYRGCDGTWHKFIYHCYEPDNRQIKLKLLKELT